MTSSTRSSNGHLPLRQQVQAALAALDGKATKRDRENLARFGITAKKAFGVSMAHIHVV